MNEYSPKTWLALEIFAVIFVLIMLSLSLPEWQIFQIQQLCMHTGSSDGVLDFQIFSGTNISLMNGDISRVFIFCIFNSTREIRENKNLAKISTYTVLQGFPTCGPQATCGPQGNTVRPAKSYTFY